MYIYDTSMYIYTRYDKVLALCLRILLTRQRKWKCSFIKIFPFSLWIRYKKYDVSIHWNNNLKTEMRRNYGNHQTCWEGKHWQEASSVNWHKICAIEPILMERNIFYTMSYHHQYTSKSGPVLNIKPILGLL